MSCESNAGRFSRLVCQTYSGISHLASKGSFYAGVAVGATGTGISMFVITKLRRPKKIPTGAASAQPMLIKVGPEGKTLETTTTGRSKPPAARPPRPGSRNNPLQLSMKPGLETQDNPAPISMENLSSLGTRNNPRSIPIQSLTGLGTRNNPAPIPIQNLTDLGTHDNPKLIPILSAKPPETQLETAPIQVLTSGGQSFTPKNSYRVLRTDGTHTGLCLTPYIREDEYGQPVEDSNAWCVTHTHSGALISGPYETMSKAHTLATQLSALRWTAATLPEADVEKAKQVIDEYQRSLAER